MTFATTVGLSRRVVTRNVGLFRDLEFSLAANEQLAFARPPLVSVKSTYSTYLAGS